MSLLGLNLRVTGYSSQGGRKYMEDTFCIAAQETEDGKDLAYAFFAIYDGHGGREASEFAKEHLMSNIVNLKNFWSDDDNLVLKAIRDGFLNTHLAMWKEVDNWPKTVSGLPSTAGTTASVAFLRKRKLYIGHVGDSKIVLGYKDPDLEFWQPQSLTTDHKPDTPIEKKRIYESGGLVMKKSGVDRVVWKRPRFGHQGPVRRSTDFDKIPFLAVARSLGDLWSYDFLHGEFVVSPEPDVCVVPLNPDKDRCLIIASDGLWNVLSPAAAVYLVHCSQRENENLESKLGITDPKNTLLSIPSKVLVNAALEQWNSLKMRADNTSVITIILDHPHTPKTVLQREQDFVKIMLEMDSSEENKDPLCEIDNENVDIYHEKDKAFPIERRTQTENNRTLSDTYNEASESHILTNSPLQSLNISHDHYNMQKYKTNDLRDNLSPFPRWSKSATGQTSLSKLVSWSRLVSKRRLSEPTQDNVANSATNSRSTSLDVPSQIKFRSHCKTPADVASYLSHNNFNPNEIEACSPKVLAADSTKNVSALKHTVKRKYPGAEVTCCNTYDCSSHPKCECTMPWKRKPITNQLNITAFKAINEFRMSQNRGLKF